MKKLLVILFSNRSNGVGKIIADFIFISVFFYFLSITSSYNLNIIITLCFITLAYFNKLYRSYFRHSNFFDLFKIFLISISISISFWIYQIYFSAVDFLQIILTFNSLLFGSIFPRLFIKYIYNYSRYSDSASNVIIYGAGETGVVTKRSLFGSIKYKPVFFIDDDPKLKGKYIDGIPVHPFDLISLDGLIEKHKISSVIISTQKISSLRKKLIIETFLKFNIKCFDIPNYENWRGDKFNENLLKSISLNSLMGRDSIEIDTKKNQHFFENKTILVTGAAGSIGGELATTLVAYDLKKLILVDSNETGLFDLKNKTAFKKKKFLVEFLQMNILNSNYFNKVFIENQIDYVFHAAAYKHVPINENTPVLGLYNNIISTYNALKNSVEHNVKKFVLVSTDKAVNPSNVMGASKRICEMMTFLNEFQNDTTKFITTRFGNVLGSNGSVVNIFKSQIEKGGPVEVTHKDITRYFMTIPEAAKLVIEACRIGLHNHLYLFDMGDPVKIDDLAKNMISMSGLTPDEDIKIEYVGLRPGEKLYEELLNNKEETVPSENKHIFIAKKIILSSTDKSKIKKLINYLNNNSKSDIELIALVKKIIPDFISMNSHYHKLD